MSQLEELFARPAPVVAPTLLGATFLVAGVGGTIIEVEAYDQEDPASHSFRGLSPANRTMFGPPGHAYVYRSYGMHWCLNFVCGPAGHGAGVLLRALAPVAGVAHMRARRRMDDVRLLCAGPGRLGQALAIDRRLDGRPLAEPPFSLTLAAAPVSFWTGPRVGLSKGQETPWRFVAAAPRYRAYLSRPRLPQAS